MTFEEAVKAGPQEIQDAYQPGKQALKGSHREQVSCSDSRRLTGSIDLDDALSTAPDHAAANRWDYGLGFHTGTREIAIWIEIHPAAAGEVGTVLRKYEWLRRWLRDEAPALNQLTPSDASQSFVWLATPAGVLIRPGSHEARRLNQAGISLPRRKLELK